MAVWVCLALLLALAGRSSATYCLCKDGLSDAMLQKTIDYACGSGADCSPILSSGACYQPNTIKDHCSYAANSYYQRKSASGATCDFSGTATPSTSPPASVPSGCVYQSSASSTGSSTTPSTSTNSPPTTTTTTTGGTTPVFGGVGLAPTGITDPNAASRLFQSFSLAVFLAFSGFLLL